MQEQNREIDYQTMGTGWESTNGYFPKIPREEAPQQAIAPLNELRTREED